MTPIFLPTVLLIFLLAAPFAVTAFFVVEMIVGLVAVAPGDKGAPAGRVAIVMPAHDEALIIARTLALLRPVADGWASILVVADNCIDDTARLAREAGASVVERHSQTERGKGFALDFARTALRAEPPAAVIVFDADCWSDRDSLRQLAALAERGQVCQAAYLITSPRDASAKVQLSNFAFMVKNLVRQRGLQRLSGRANLTGTGMAFPWAVFDAAPLATDNVVEDYELGMALAAAGHPPQFAPGAIVWSAPSNDRGTLVQRTRWEGGVLAVARQRAPRAILHAMRRASPRALAEALDLCVPPLTLLAAIDAAVLGLALALTWLLGAAWWPVGLHLVACLLAAACVALAWAREGRALVRFRTLLGLPLYMLWKVPMYLGLMRNSPREWLRTGR